MNDSWLRYPIYLNGEQRFDANPSGDVSVVDAYERMDFVFENIEFCFAEGRLMDVEIFDRLDTLSDQIRANDIPHFDQIADLVDSIRKRYAFNDSGSAWTRKHESGAIVIWIDRDKIVAKSNKELFG